MTHDSKKFLRMTMFALIVGMVSALFAYTCKEVAVFVAAFTFIADLVFISVILSLRSNYKRFNIPVYLYMMIIVIIFTVLITVLAGSQLVSIL